MGVEVIGHTLPSSGPQFRTEPFAGDAHAGHFQESLQVAILDHQPRVGDDLLDRTAPIRDHGPKAGHGLAHAVAEGLVFARADEHVDPVIEGLDILELAEPEEATSHAGLLDLVEDLGAVRLSAGDGVAGQDPDHAPIVPSESGHELNEVLDPFPRLDHAGLADDDLVIRDTPAATRCRTLDGAAAERIQPDPDGHEVLPLVGDQAANGRLAI